MSFTSDSSFAEVDMFKNKSLKFINEDYELEWSFENISRNVNKLRCLMAAIIVNIVLLDAYYMR